VLENTRGVTVSRRLSPHSRGETLPM